MLMATFSIAFAEIQLKLLRNSYILGLLGRNGSKWFEMDLTHLWLLHRDPSTQLYVVDPCLQWRSL